MRQIRIGTFETNSSSTHTLVIVNKDEYEKFKNGEMIWNREEGKLQTIEDAKKSLIADRKRWDKSFEASEDEIEELIEDETETYDEFGSGYETFEQEFETQSGDKIIAFGYFGYS
jgi:hypothetical protein